MPRPDAHVLNMFRICLCQRKGVSVLNIRTDEC